MSTDEPDLFDRLRAVARAAGKLDRGTQLQLNLMLEAALERTVDHDPQPRIEATCRPVLPTEPAQPSTTDLGNPQPLIDPTDSDL